MRVFVTGIYAVGKTTLAKNMASERGLRYVPFDSEWLLLESYPKGVEAAEAFYDVVPTAASARRGRQIVLMRRRS